MTHNDLLIREPDQIRQDCVRKLQAVKISDHFSDRGTLQIEGHTSDRQIEGNYTHRSRDAQIEGHYTELLTLCFGSGFGVHSWCRTLSFVFGRTVNQSSV